MPDDVAKLEKEIEILRKQSAELADRKAAIDHILKELIERLEKQKQSNFGRQ